MNHVMVDLETLGNGSNAVIVSIGAVVFDVQSGLQEEFYRVIDMESCVAAGLKIDTSTVQWWMGQSDAARAVFAARERNSLNSALREFAVYFPEKAKLWGNGATFDNVILDNAYRAINMPRPWAYWDDRCYRTLKGLAPSIKMQREGVYHNALDDAKSQALHAIEIMKHLGVR